MSLKQIKRLIQISVDPKKSQEEQSIAALKACALLDATNLLNTRTRWAEGDVNDSGFRLIESKYSGFCHMRGCNRGFSPGCLIWWRAGYPACCDEHPPRLPKSERPQKHDHSHGAF